MDTQNRILVVVERIEDAIRPVTLETVAFARRLAGRESAAIRIVVPGRDVRDAAGELADRTGIDAIALEAESLDPYSAETWRLALAALIREQGASHICIPHTSRGCDFAPALAAGIGASCITAVEEICGERDSPTFVRSIFNGKMRMRVRANRDVTVLTVQPGAFPADSPTGPLPEKRKAGVEILRVPASPHRTRALGVLAAGEENLELALADTVVSAGRGIGAEENLGLIRKLAGLFSKSAVGCSRTVCDRGWLDFGHQIGLTGKTVSPKLYIACGISGAVQHLAGMRGSKYVVAINTDPGAAIFREADVGIVEDLTTFIPLVVGRCHPLSGGPVATGDSGTAAPPRGHAPGNGS
ncbi:MAG: Electron transfer flavoprotein subunit alpha [Syntrophaceae bacterium PtaB.Bin095]|jgi:electron transfer flavoprotein alpha subunit|nr:MAG: Electron transfer flavoprotein subunit alpha [Syntrophaceae bacterium PtaB.Bin095]